MENTALELTRSCGYGYGDGYGSGDGYGYGSGDGYGSGSGYGYGYGYGDGYGSGDGSGDGYGYGYGYGSGSVQQVYLAALLEKHRVHGAIVGFWRCHPDGRPANGGSGTVAKVGLVEEISGPLSICTANALHATNAPNNWNGEHWWIVALHEPVQQRDDKFGSLKRTFLEHLGRYPF